MRQRTFICFATERATMRPLPNLNMLRTPASTLWNWETKPPALHSMLSAFETR